MLKDRHLRHLSLGISTTVSLVERGGDLCVRKQVASGARHIQEARDQIVAESRLLSLLPEGIAPRLLDAGVDEAGPFFVMEYFPWPTLSEAAPEPHSVGAFVDDVLSATLSVLARAHAAEDAEGPLSLVHSDISPSNLLVERAAGRAILIDFGLARTRLSADPGGGAFRGTLMYAAPEGARGESLDARSDLFSLAASVVHVATGIAPRRAASRPALLLEAGEQPLDDWLALAAKLFSRSAFDVLAACLQFEPERRPASARAAIAALRG